MSLIFATQLTAVATLALAGLPSRPQYSLASPTGGQSQEVRLLIAQNKRDTEERHRAQAARVFLGAPPGDGHLVSPYVMNASEFPVYDVEVEYLESGGVGEPETIGVMLPGERRGTTRVFEPAPALTGTYCTFRDA